MAALNEDDAKADADADTSAIPNWGGNQMVQNNASAAVTTEAAAIRDSTGNHNGIVDAEAVGVAIPHALPSTGDDAVQQMIAEYFTPQH